VNPVTEAGATSRKVFLPGKAAWTDFDTGKQIPAGEVADMPAPLGARQGSFPTMLKEDHFHLVFVGEGHGVGGGDTDRPDSVVKYIGEAINVQAGR